MTLGLTEHAYDLVCTPKNEQRKALCKTHVKYHMTYVEADERRIVDEINA